MTSIKRFALPLMLLGASMGLQAQAVSGWQAGAGLSLCLDSLRDYTNQSLGISLQGDYQVPLSDSKSAVRFGAEVDFFPGKAREGRKISLEDYQIHGDVVIPLGDSKVSLVAGLSLNAWVKQVSGPDAFDPAQSNDTSGSVKRAFGKLGFRTGLEMPVTEKLTGQVLLQVTELGTDNEFLKDGDPVWGKSAVNPSWIGFSMRYRF